VSNGPELISASETRERNWLPLVIAAVAVLLGAAVVVTVLEHGKRTPTVAPVSSAADPYAASLPISGLQMSESANLAGGKVTYLDGRIANQGNKNVTAISFQVIFRNPAQWRPRTRPSNSRSFARATRMSMWSRFQ
jgi:hypothetical protein